MPHFPKPFFRKDRGLWYVQINGKQHNLGPDRDEAFRGYRDLMAAPQEVSKEIPKEFLFGLIKRFTDYVRQNRAPETAEWYRYRLQLLVNHLSERGLEHIRAEELRPFHIQEWIDCYPQLAKGSKRNLARSIMRCMNWCDEQGLIDKNPIRHFKKPRGGTRNNVISLEEYERIRAACKPYHFRDLVTFAWETGARAAECLAIEKRHVDLANHRIVFPVDEEKMERAPRIIYLTDTAEEIIRRLMVRWPKGKLFRNAEGAPWTTDAVNCAFMRVQRKLGKKWCLTDFRHSWCHHKLCTGVDALTVSVLMGHADPTMIARVYSHLTHAPEYLLTTARKTV
jgi:integrase